MINILIAEDYQLFRETLVNTINAQLDMNVVGEASSGREALMLSKALHPDLILMDFGLPQGTGLKTMEAILADQPETNIVFLTVFAESSLLIKAIRGGAKGYIIKDATSSQLLEFIRGVDRGEMAISPHMVTRLTDELYHLPPTESDLLE